MNPACQNCKKTFPIEAEDIAFYEKMQVPAPTLCPHCRMIRRFLWRNEHYLFKRKDEATGNEVFSGTPAAAPYKVVNHDYWWSDEWSGLDYGREYDFSRPFFEQFGGLLREVPWCARTILNLVNSDYSDQASYLKNCYLCFDADNNEDCAYVINSGYIKEGFDLLSCIKSELCFNGVMVNNSYRTHYSFGSDGCRDSWFLKNCVGCSDCVACVNLKNKQYCIFNQQYSKEEYQRKLRDLNLGSYDGLKKLQAAATEHWGKYPVKCATGFRNLASTGQFINDSKNARRCFIANGIENGKYLQLVFYKCSDSYDYTVWGDNASRMYEAQCCGQQVDNIRFCHDCWPASRDMEYSISCRSSHDLFGCVGLRNKEYCILNKQYSKEEYFALKARIIAHMNEMPYTTARGHQYRYGEFFPEEFSHLAYNQTLAHDLFPLTKDEAVARGYRWQDADPKEYETSMHSADLPDHISEAGDTLKKEIIKCGECGKAYRIIDMELAFYRKTGIPIPRECLDCRLKKRFTMWGRPVYHERICQCSGSNSRYANGSIHAHGDAPCGNRFETVYPPDSTDLVYCENCYQQEVG